jgi:glycosyltransferase involved in cell wall biosynthesis
MNKKIYINARFLTQPITGVQRFAIELSKELKQSNHSIVFLSPRDIIHKELSSELEVKTIGFLKGHLWEQLELQPFVFFNKGLLISFCNTAPLFLKDQIVTVHDLCFRIYPQWFSKPFSLFYNFMIPKICNNSKAIITVSETSKNELHHELGIPLHKVSVIYNGVADIFKKNIDVSMDPLVVGDYILTVSSHHPRKNFTRLVEAFKLLNNKNLKLCIVGNMHKNFKDTRKEINDNILYLNNISDAELLNYYKHAKLFVFPSVYEGFGIPIIEAMQFDVPVCVSDIPVFNEICIDNAIYFNPLLVEDISSKIKKCLSNPIKSSVDFTKFNWRNGAQQIIELININYVK